MGIEELIVSKHTSTNSLSRLSQYTHWIHTERFLLNCTDGSRRFLKGKREYKVDCIDAVNVTTATSHYSISCPKCSTKGWASIVHSFSFSPDTRRTWKNTNHRAQHRAPIFSRFFRIFIDLMRKKSAVSSVAVERGHLYWSMVFSSGGSVASWLVRLSSDRASGDIVLCSQWARHFTLSVPLFSQVCK